MFKRIPGNHFAPSGWMGDDGNLKLEDDYQNNCYDKSCLRIQYQPKEGDKDGWAGIVWQNTLNNWFDPKHAFDLREYRKFSFWACGAKGGEVISEIGLGGASSNSDDVKRELIVLEKEWRRYEIDLMGYDLSQIIHGFKVIFKEIENSGGAMIYLDEIMLSQ